MTITSSRSPGEPSGQRFRSRSVHRARRKIAGRLLVACVLLAGGIAASVETLGRPTRTHRARAVGVIPDTVGTIAAVTIHFDPDAYQGALHLFQDLFQALPPEVDVTVLCASADDVDLFLETWGEVARDGERQLSVINTGLHLSLWSRDRYIARQPVSLGGVSTSLLSAPFADLERTKINELMAYEVMAETGHVSHFMPQWIRIEGGNVVSNRRHAFVGINVLDDNLARPRSAAFRETLQDVLGRDYVLIADRNGEPPWVHTDMYITPIDDYTILVGSPTLGSEILDQSGEWALLPGNDQSLDESSADEETYRTCWSDPVQISFDDAADQLRSLGYRVIRTPVIPDVEGNWMVTYNNVLLEQRDGKRIAYLPKYQIPSLDKAGEEIYTRLGFEVRTLDVSGVFTFGGAVRCVTNVTRRVNPMLAGAGRDAGTPNGSALRIHDLTSTGAFRQLVDEDGLASASFPAAETQESEDGLESADDLGAGVATDELEPVADGIGRTP